MATAQGNSSDKSSSFSTQTPPSGAPSCPTEQTCGMKHYQKHPRHSPQHFQPLAFCCPSLTASSAGLWECRGWHKLLWVVPELGNPAPPLLQCGTTWKQEPTPRDTALTRKTPPPASLGVVREVLVSHQPSMPDPTQLRGGVSISVTSNGHFSPASASHPSLFFSPPTGREDSRVLWLIQITAASGRDAWPRTAGTGKCWRFPWGWEWERYLLEVKGSRLAPSMCTGRVPPALSLPHPRDSSLGQG